MALAVNITDGHGLSNEACCWLLPKKSKVMLYFPLIHSNSHLTSCTLLTRQSASVKKWVCRAGCGAYKGILTN